MQEHRYPVAEKLLKPHLSMFPPVELSNLPSLEEKHQVEWRPRVARLNDRQICDKQIHETRG